KERHAIGQKRQRIAASPRWPGGRLRVVILRHVDSAFLIFMRESFCPVADTVTEGAPGRIEIVQAGKPGTAMRGREMAEELAWPVPLLTAAPDPVVAITRRSAQASLEQRSLPCIASRCLDRSHIAGLDRGG